jgi:cathepsin L
MKAVLAVLLCLGLASAFTEQEYEGAFTQWMGEFEKSYAPEEFFYRYNVFKTNMDYVAETNAKNLSYTVELNRFADLSTGEYSAIYLGYKGDLRRSSEKLTMPLVDLPNAYPNGALDWTTKNAVTAVKDQGQCGSCWAFSTTGSVEGAVAIAHGALNSLSEQELMDCSWSYGNMACNGGLMDNAFKYVMSAGLCTEKAYPYTATSSKTCKASSCTMSSFTKISNYKDVAHNENSLGAAVDIGPVSVAIEADQTAFQLYKGGVFNAACGQNLDHGVLVVGYGTDASSGLDFWKVKNSWGTSWGEAGYIRMVRNKDECGIANEPSYPVD